MKIMANDKMRLILLHFDAKAEDALTDLARSYMFRKTDNRAMVLSNSLWDKQKNLWQLAVLVDEDFADAFIAEAKKIVSRYEGAN